MTVPTFGLTATGTTRHEALLAARKAVDQALHEHIRRHEPIPKPKRVRRAAPDGEAVLIAPSLEMALRTAIIAALQAEGLRDSDLAQHLGLDPSYISRTLRRGGRGMSPSRAASLLEDLGLSVHLGVHPLDPQIGIRDHLQRPRRRRR